MKLGKMKVNIFWKKKEWNVQIVIINLFVYLHVNTGSFNSGAGTTETEGKCCIDQNETKYFVASYSHLIAMYSWNRIICDFTTCTKGWWWN